MRNERGAVRVDPSYLGYEPPMRLVRIGHAHADLLQRKGKVCAQISANRQASRFAQDSHKIPTRFPYKFCKRLRFTYTSQLQVLAHRKNQIYFAAASFSFLLYFAAASFSFLLCFAAASLDARG